MNSLPWSESQEFVNELTPLLRETGGGGVKLDVK